MSDVIPDAEALQVVKRVAAGIELLDELVTIGDARMPLSDAIAMMEDELDARQQNAPPEHC